MTLRRDLDIYIRLNTIGVLGIIILMVLHDLWDQTLIENGRCTFVCGVNLI